MLHAQLLTNAALATPIYALSGLAFLLILRTNKYWPISISAAMTLAAYLVYGLAGGRGGMLLPIVASLGAVATLGAVIEWSVFQRLRRTEERSQVQLLAAVAIAGLALNLVALVWGDSPLTIPTEGAAAVLQVSDVFMTGIQIVSAALAGLALAAFFVADRTTRWGLFRQAVDSNEGLALIRGIPVNRVQVAAGALAFLGAGMAGIMMGFDTDLSPTMGFDRMIACFIIAVLTLHIHPLRLVAVSAIFGLLEQYLTIAVDGGWRTAALMAAMAVIIFARRSALSRLPLK